VAGCDRKKSFSSEITPPPEEEVPTSEAAPATPTPRPLPVAKSSQPTSRVPVSTKSAPARLWKEFSAEQAWAEAKRLVDFGPRPTGSPENAKTRTILAGLLKNFSWEVEEQPFTIETPKAQGRGVNVIARFSADGSRPVAKTPRSVAIVAHYDTRPFSTIRFVGANDGASGPAVLLEIARCLSLNPQLAAKVELVFVDASEPLGQYSESNGLSGSRHFLAQLGEASAAQRVIVLHCVGDGSTQLTLPPETPPEMASEVKAALTALDSSMQMEILPYRAWGDHVPFQRAGFATLLLSNHDFLGRYTADDTMQQVNRTKLKQVGELALYLTKRWAETPR
jgi:hypothetical protein